MTGYRSGFAAGDPDLIAALKAFRPTVGTAPQEFVQRASVVAWGDEEHVAETRARYGRKRALLLDLFARKGVRVAGSEATMYIWAEVPEGETSESFAERLLEHGVLVTPGSYLGAAGEGYFRVALVPVRGRSAPAPSRSWSACCDTRARARDRRGARQGRTPRRLARRRRLGRRRRGEGGDPRVLPPPQSRADDGRPVLLQDKIPLKVPPNAASASSRRASPATARSSRTASC